MPFVKQTWILTKKDLLIVARRNWLTTIARALVLPIIVTLVLSFIPNFTATGGHYGVGDAFQLLSLPDALRAGSARSKFVIVDNNLAGKDVQAVIERLSSTVQQAGKDLHIVPDAASLPSICPASSRGITNCFAAVEFSSSPDQGPDAIWNYTLHYDGTVGSTFDVRSHENAVQIYVLPLQHEIDSMITSSHGGPGLPNNIQQFGFTYTTEETKDREDRRSFNKYLVLPILSWAFFIAICGITYHLTGHVVRQRENGLLQLVDAMMPNKPWECIAARIMSTHLAFDLIYAPAWIAMGAITGASALPQTGAGWFILLYVLCGLALTSFSILASSFFRREQLAAMSTVITAVVLAIVAQFGEQLGGDGTPPGIWALAVLFPPSTFTFFIQLSGGCGGTWLINKNSQDCPYSPVTSATLLGLFVFQILLYPILGAVVERYLHGNSSRSRHLRAKDEMGGYALRLTGFSKRYSIAAKKRDRIQAVDDLSLNLHAGSITVLLGANGSGKTTTLNAIAGLETITTGQIEIEGSAGIGLCPQKNVHWGAMTVEEHVRFFEQLKRPSLVAAQSQHEVDRIIVGCDLEIKKHCAAKTLSGGQMRKLQLAMMLAGGSQVCCIDEASSGIDPLARRKVWEILLAERGERTMLLTTHFLDETEVLSDHVAVLSKGKLKADGSVAALKTQYGGGYHVVLPNRGPSANLTDLPLGVTYNQDYNSIALNVPDTSTLTPLLERLERSNISDYRIRGPTIEDVFLKLAEEMNINERESRQSDTSPIVRHDSNESESRHALAKTAVPAAMELNTGKGCGPLKQTGILFLKRLTVLKHNFMPYVGALFVPLVLAAMVPRLLIFYTLPGGLRCSNSQDYYGYPWALQLGYLSYDGVFGPASTASKSDLERFVPNEPDNYGYSTPPHWRLTHFVDSMDEFNNLIEETVTNKKYTWGGFYVGDQISFAYEGLDSTSGVFAQGALDMILSNTTFQVNTESFVQPYKPSDTWQGLVAVITVLGFTVYPGLFALYPTAERLRNVRAMHYSNGILSSSLWVAYALFDFMFIMIVSVLATVIWFAEYEGWYALGYMFVVFLLYGMAATVYSYVISLFVKSQLAAMACTTLAQTAIAMLFFVGYVVANSNAPATRLYDWFDYIYYTIALICPAVSLFRALLVCLNVYALACRGNIRGTYPGELGLYGGPILYLTLQCVLLVALLMYWESGRSLEVFGIRRKRSKSIVEEVKPVHDPDAAEDEKHLALSNDGLRVYNLSKSFKSVQAVENISVGMLPSEKLALLGPNGAGKSTTISLIRGELRPDTTDPPAAVYISGDSLMRTPVAAKNHLGVCPQFDAVDAMTLSEHLHFYARARGVPDKDQNIRELITTLGLTEHQHKLVKKLSGGTKRKLSLAIALVANPSVLLLDEPSSGMDPAAKRALWSTLTNISAGRCLLLTTHSMEEAAALCDRAAIMASKMLALGTISDLCARHGDKIYIHLVHQNAPYTSSADVSAIWQWVKSTFVIAEAERRTYGGQIRFAVPIRNRNSERQTLADGNDMGLLFRIIEEKKVEMGIRDYSIGPTTLDTVFLNVVSRHDVVEENTEVSKDSKWSASRLLRRRAGSRV